MKVSQELSEILKEATEEVSKWEPWQRSFDPYGAKPAKEGETNDE